MGTGKEGGIPFIRCRESVLLCGDREQDHKRRVGEGATIVLVKG